MSFNLNHSYNYCLDLANNHYENFPVASFFISPPHRKHIAVIYAFARTADDFADESFDKNKLLDWRRQLYDCIDQKYENQIFFALSHTIKKYGIPIKWLDDLITAFLMDLGKNRYSSIKDLQSYCQYSANPVGRLVLWICGYRSSDLVKYSDFITTALQLTNFWQDISVDLTKNRIYIPLDHLNLYGISEEDLINRKNSIVMQKMISDLTNKTKLIFYRGLPLLKQIHGRLRLEIIFTIKGGLRILEKVNMNRKIILNYRPMLTKWDWMSILANTIIK
jgi:squalene synthase HpnC